MATRVKRVGGPDPKKPYHTIYGRNRWSKNLRTFSRNHTSLEDARREMKVFREAQGHDYTFSISSHWERV